VRALAAELGVVGLMNAQFAVQGDNIYLLEVNPRASRTVPFVSKVTGQTLAKIAARVMIGRKLDELGVTVRSAGPLRRLTVLYTKSAKQPLWYALCLCLG